MAATESPKNIVYLFGAGATHAELLNAYPNQTNEGLFFEKNGLLMAGVSKRVCHIAKKSNLFSKEISNLLSPAGLSNIELFISLIENNEIKSENTVERLKRLIRKDILDRLTSARLKKFYLHKSLLEFHQVNNASEKLSGIISLNYDGVIDEAYESIFDKKPNYCLSSDGSNNDIPLLKLHGGFDLKYRKHKLPIITPGVNKNYLELPYNFIWGRALEILIDCDILRIIGCSLSQNDMGLVDLLFKAHLARKQKEPFLIQLVRFDRDDSRIKENLGFLPKVETMRDIENNLVGDQANDPTKGGNPFKIWLKAKIDKTMKPKEIENTKYMKKVVE